MKLCTHIRHKEPTAETSSSWMLLKQDKHDGFSLFLNTVGTGQTCFCIFQRLAGLSQPETAAYHTVAAGFGIAMIEMVHISAAESCPCCSELPVALRVTGEVPAVTPGLDAPHTSALLPWHVPAEPCTSPKPWQQEVLEDGDVPSLLLLLRSSSCSESGWADTFPGVTWGRVPACRVTLGLTSGAPRSCNQLFKLITISMASSKELRVPLICKHTSQTHGVFVSILLKPSCLVFLLLWGIFAVIAQLTPKLFRCSPAQRLFISPL